MAEHPKYISLNPKLYDYLVAHGHNGDPLREELAAETTKLGWISAMQIAAEQGTFMGILAGAIGARSAVEVGTFTGYSALCVARALPVDGHLLCCDVNEQWTSVGRKYWERAGVANKITLKLAPDADKSSYAIYYEEILKRLRPNGLILIDNVLWNGAIVDEAKTDADTLALRKLNDFIPTDTRVEAVMLGIADGLTIVRKK